MKKMVTKLVLALTVMSLSVPVLAAPVKKPAQKTGDTVKMTVEVNEKKKKVDNALMVDGVTYLPMRYIFEELLNYELQYDGEKKHITVTEKLTDEQLAHKEELTADINTHLTPFELEKEVKCVLGNKEEDKVPYRVSLSNIVRGKDAEKFLVEQYLQVRPNADKSDALESIKKSLPTTNYEFLICDVSVSLASNSSGKPVVLKTNSGDFVAVCGDAIEVDGLNKQYTEYSKVNTTLHKDTAYTDRTIYQDGSTEGKVVFAVYKDDKTPRVRYKTGQWFKLY